MLLAALFSMTRMWKLPKCPSTDEWILKKVGYTHNGMRFGHTWGSACAGFPGLTGMRPGAHPILPPRFLDEEPTDQKHCQSRVMASVVTFSPTASKPLCPWLPAPTGSPRAQGAPLRSRSPPQDTVRPHPAAQPARELTQLSLPRPPQVTGVSLSQGPNSLLRPG